MRPQVLNKTLSHFPVLNTLPLELEKLPAAADPHFTAANVLATDWLMACSGNQRWNAKVVQIAWLQIIDLVARNIHQKIVKQTCGQTLPQHLVR